ncbi:MAG: phosphoenolpyruvate--protein phosphotransferase, partial [Chloroflexi bacterium]|nr:phosphoenolpyruvate--protein phosphotransferase [Chloroflexota bacterium]
LYQQQPAPGGLEWNQGESVHLVVGIAARSDEHLEVLANLTHVLVDEATVRALSNTHNAADIVQALTKAPEEAPTRPTGERLTEFPNYIEVKILGAHGLHARPATAFVDIAKQFQCEIHVRHDRKIANGKSLVSLLQLGVEGGSTLRIMAHGQDADTALQALKAAVESGLGEEEGVQPARPGVQTPQAVWTPTEVGRMVPGISASPGLAIGPVQHYQHQKIVVEAHARDPKAEKSRLNQAVASALAELDQLYQEVKSRSGAGQAAIFRAHAEFLNDPELIDETVKGIDLGFSAGWSWQQVIQERVEAMQKLDDPIIAGRAIDLSDVGKRVLKQLANILDDAPFAPEKPVIMIAEDLSPSDTASLNPDLILGLCTAGGGPTSHTAIIARSLNIPAIVGTGPALLNLADGTIAILDGGSGNLYLEPSAADIDSARQAQASLEQQRNAEYLARYQPAFTTDGYRMEIVANISRASEAAQAVAAGAEGVGLLRTEFLFLERAEPPSEDEQYAAYAEMVRALAGLPLIIRTLDIGGDKKLPYLNLPPEDNSFLGVRGIRLCLVRPDLFLPQLRAIYRASMLGPVKIMYPMIATVEDLDAALDFSEQARQEVGAGPVEAGIMIEVPSAVLLADQLAKKVDFFSIGTNDLTQYTLAMDRLHPMLARRADGLHPAVLRMVDKTVQAAQEAGKWVGVCGGVAGDPKGAILLMGLGVTELSLSIPSVAAIKARLRNISVSEARSLAKQALACRNAAEVRMLAYPGGGA